MTIRKTPKSVWPKEPKFTASQAHELKNLTYKSLGGWSMVTAMLKLSRKKPRLNYMDELDVALRFYGAVTPPKDMDVLMNSVTIRKEGDSNDLENSTYTLIFDKFGGAIFMGPRFHGVKFEDFKHRFLEATGVWLELES